MLKLCFGTALEMPMQPHISTPLSVRESKNRWLSGVKATIKTKRVTKKKDLEKLAMSSSAKVSKRHSQNTFTKAKGFKIN